MRRGRVGEGDSPFLTPASACFPGPGSNLSAFRKKTTRVLRQARRVCTLGELGCEPAETARLLSKFSKGRISKRPSSLTADVSISEDRALNPEISGKVVNY